jgi:3-dehydroquinate dehydratase-2
VRLLVLQGPNLNLLGSREPQVYGTETLAEIEARLQEKARAWHDLELRCFQSNSEGQLIDWLHGQAPGAQALILNPGGLAHTSVVLRDAVAAIGLPAIEVHISNIFAREEFRQRSLLAGACLATISGLGTFGYEAALEALARRAELRRRS